MKIRVIILAIIIGFVYRQIRNYTKSFECPTFNTKLYWGPGKPQTKEIAIINFQVQFDPDHLRLLKEKLSRPLRLPVPLENTTSSTEYGVDLIKFEKLIEYWRKKYLPKWFQREKFLNSLPHYITKIQGLTLHYLHTKVSDADKENKIVYPMLLLHGWPGSVREFYDIIPKLTVPKTNTTDEIIFEVVAPSLPGFAWSDAAAKPGFGIVEMAIVLRNLMLRVGYDRFFIQGGDWGSILGSTIATIFPENVIGYHSNLCYIQTPLSFMKAAIASIYPAYFIDEQFIDYVFPIRDKFMKLLQESGYFHIQATKPDTIGAVLQNNPIGLAAYYYEKFSEFSVDIPMEAFLDNLMIHYFTNSSTTAVRLYAEAMTAKQLSYNMVRVPTAVPTGCARFKHEISHSLDWQLRDKYPNLIHSTYYDVGGHFAALETPDVLYNDFMVFIGKCLKFIDDNNNNNK